MSTDTAPRRMLEIDALRGLAAMAVVLFHYTTRLQELYPATPTALWSVPWGHYGVNLFFILSGFVIFMTLERAKQAMDFVVSRFSRLYPAYWFSLALTFVLTGWLGLEGKTVDLSTALGNLLMFHGLFQIPHVDGVYWTLEVELLFYCGMFALYRCGQLPRVWLACLLLLMLRLAYYLLATVWQIELSWTLSRLLILPYIPWFTLGIAIYLAGPQRPARDRRKAGLMAGAALASLALEDSLQLAALALALASVVLLASRGLLPLLKLRVIVWLGAISYPLYLLHENIGWALILALQRQGQAHDLAIILTLGLILLLAHAVSAAVERPAMRWIRERYQRRQRRLPAC